MRKKRGMVGLGMLVAATVCGCAKVNPTADYEQVAARVREATGRESIYQPGEEEVVSRKVEALLAEGLAVDEAVQICLLNNPRLQAGFMDVGMARADVVQSGLLSNPTLGVSLRFPAGGGLANLEAGMAQNIADLWQIPARKRASERVLDGAILELARRAAELAAEAKGAYYRAVAAEERHKLAEENVLVARNLLELAETRQRAGAGTELDVNLSRTVLIEAELSVESRRLESANAGRVLAGLMGMTVEASELVLVSRLPEEPAEKPDAEGLMVVARRRRLDIRAAEQMAASAKARLEEEYGRVFRKVELGLSLERGERKRQGGRDILADTARASIAGGSLTAPTIQPRSARDRDTEFIIGPSLSMELPIFDQNQAQIARAQYAYAQAMKTLEALEREVAQEVRGVVDRSLTAWRQARIYRERSIPLAESNLALSREAYRAGRASFLAVLEAQRFSLDSRTRYVDASERAAKTIPELERAVGVPFEELMASGASMGDSERREDEGVEP